MNNFRNLYRISIDKNMSSDKHKTVHSPQERTVFLLMNL